VVLDLDRVDRVVPCLVVVPAVLCPAVVPVVHDPLVDRVVHDLAVLRVVHGLAVLRVVHGLAVLLARVDLFLVHHEPVHPVVDHGHHHGPEAHGAGLFRVRHVVEGHGLAPFLGHHGPVDPCRLWEDLCRVDLCHVVDHVPVDPFLWQDLCRVDLGLVVDHDPVDPFLWEDLCRVDLGLVVDHDPVDLCLPEDLCQVVLDHGRVDHVVEHPWQVDLFLWQVALVLYLVDLFPCLVVHVHDREDLYLFRGALVHVVVVVLYLGVLVVGRPWEADLLVVLHGPTCVNILVCGCVVVV